MNRSTTSSFMPFLLAAIALHAGVLSWMNTSPSMQLGGATMDALAVSLAESPMGDSGSKSEKSIERNDALPKEADDVQMQAVAEKAAEPSQIQQEVSLTHATTKTETSTAAPSEASLASIRQHVQTELARHFHYPNMAIRRNWSGAVEVVFRVEPDGRVYDVRMKKSSGRSVLDDAALQAMQKVERIRLDPQLKLAHAVELALPVIYRLQG
jgi:TonB family protein